MNTILSFDRAEDERAQSQGFLSDLSSVGQCEQLLITVRLLVEKLELILHPNLV